MDIIKFRKTYPQYDDMSDVELSDALYTKHYSDIPREEFDAKFIAPTLPVPEVNVYGGVDPEGVAAEQAETQKALDFIGGLSEAQMTGPTEGKVGFQEGGTSDAVPIGVFGETAVQTAKDVAGVVTKAGAGLTKGATLGAIDPEAGTVGIPFTDVKKKVAKKLSVSLQEVLGTSPEIAENPYIQVAPEMVGTILPWQKAQKLVSAVGKAKTGAGRVAETAITGALIGAAEVRDKDESQLMNALEYATVGAGLHLAGEAAIPLVNYIKSVAKYKNVTKNISADDLYKAFTGQEGATAEATNFVTGLTRQQKVNMAKNIMRKGEGIKVKEKVPRKAVEKPVIKPGEPKIAKPIAEAKPIEKVAKIKEVPSDKKISKGIPSKVKEGEKLVEAKPVKAGGKEKVEAGGVLRKEKEVSVPRETKPYAIGSSVKVGKSPQINTILEELPATKQEKELGERFFKVKNEKTGEIQEVTFEDITPIKLKPITPEPAVPLKEKVSKKLAEEKGEVKLRADEAFAGKKVPVWEDIKKMRKSSAEKRKTSIKQIAKELNKAVIDVSGNLKRKALKAGPEGKKVIMRHDLIAGAHSAAIRNVNKATDAIYKGLNEADHDYLDSYLYAKRSLEILKDRPDFKFFGDRKKADFEEMLESIPKEVRGKIEKRAEKSWDVYNNILKRYHNEGMITKNEYTELTQRGKNYSPREILEYIDPGAIGGGGKISVPNSGIKALTDEGSLKAIESDSSLLMSQALSRAETRIFRNRAAKSLYDMAKANPDNGVVSLAKVIRTTKDGKPVYEPATNGFEKISVMIDGQKKEMIMPSDMAKEWIKSDPVLNSNVAETISWLSGTKVLKSMATGLNPEFALTNFPRDLAHVWLTTQEYSKQAPLAALQLGKDIKEVWSDAIFRKGLYTEYVKRGGGMEFLTHQGRFAPKLKGHLGQLQNVMGYTGESSEIAVRLALMQRSLKNMKKAGRTDTEEMLDEATWIARNYLDFSQGGSVVKAADTAIPYLNAAIQGTRGVFRAAESHPGKTAYKMAQIAATATGLFYANYYQNKENWDSIPHRDKVNNWIITTPFSYKDKEGNKKWLYVRIPKDQGQRLVTSIAEQAAAKAIGEEVDMAQVTQAAADFVPISPGALAPPMFKAFKGYELNKDFYRGEDIWRGSREDIKAEEEYYKNYTHDFFIKAGKETGLSPERLKYALGQYFTSGNIWTSMVGFGWDNLFAEMTEDQKEKVTEELILKKPFIRKLFRHTDPYHKFSKEIKDVTIEERTKKFVMMRDFNDIVQKKLEDKATNKDVVNFIKKNPKEAGVLKDHYKRAILLKDMPERRYWKELAKIPAPARARLFWSRWQGEAPEERIKSLKTAVKIPGFYSDAFNVKFGELRNQTMKEEANKGRK
jgi:hypothetical protein